MAVFTLPSEMIGFFKYNIEFVTAHAVDPDKRRYATKHEAVRHYIDIDHWGEKPFETVPKNYNDALAKYLQVNELRSNGDTIVHFKFGDDYKDIVPFIRNNLMPQYYEDEWKFNCDSLMKYFPRTKDCDRLEVNDTFSEYGILPYHLLTAYHRLVKAFQLRDKKLILQQCADMGHYIGDAHVPLHTTENYNGQLTDQVGIHAFWESRLPELFADEDYDFFVGRASYLENPKMYFWKIVEDSHGYLDDVLDIEKRLSQTFPRDEQYCYEERLDQTVFMPCKAYSEAYHSELSGMVEERMQDAILAIGSVWYSAWVDAGQPELKSLGSFKPDREAVDSFEKQDAQYKSGNIFGRGHGE